MLMLFITQARVENGFLAEMRCKVAGISFCGSLFLDHTVDGRNPAPPGMYKTL